MHLFINVLENNNVIRRIYNDSTIYLCVCVCVLVEIQVNNYRNNRNDKMIIIKKLTIRNNFEIFFFYMKFHARTICFYIFS